MVLIRLRTAVGAELASSVTRESADLLALRPGVGVLALCKATAGKPAAQGAANQRPDRIERIAKGLGRDEVVLALEGGGQWVGFAEHPFTARPMGLGGHVGCGAGGGPDRLNSLCSARWFI